MRWQLIKTSHEVRDGLSLYKVYRVLTDPITNGQVMVQFHQDYFSLSLVVWLGFGYPMPDACICRDAYPGQGTPPCILLVFSIFAAAFGSVIFTSQLLELTTKLY